MGARGRKSTTEMTTAPGVVAVVERPEPLLDLTPEQADVWRDVVDAMPADWFPRETWGLLGQYCRHVVEARRIAQLIDQECAREDLDVLTYDRLLKLQRQESASIKAMSASMRLSQQSSYNAKSASTAKGRGGGDTIRRPWQ